jgi:hypothetical protein
MLGAQAERERARIRAKRGAPQIARSALRDRSRCGAPALPEVLSLTSAGRDRGAKPFPLWGLAALSYLEPVAVGVLELRDVAPGELEHVRDELDPARLQLLDRLPTIVGFDRDRR